MSNSPLVSIISINYNGLQLTLDMLASFKNVTYPNIEIIIVDNASKEIPDQIVKDFPEVILFKNLVNEGFAGGNNRGMEIAKGDYFLLLNNDTEVPPGFLEPLVDRAEMDKNIGIICPKLLYFDHPGIIQYAGYTPINPVTGRGHGIGINHPDDGTFDTACITHRAHGAAMFIPRKVVENAGLMAELYFLYYEEMDYCERIKKAGYDIWYEPASHVYHKESMTTGKNSLLKTYYLSRNRLLYLRRNVRWPIFVLTILYYFLIAVPKNVLQLVLKREWKHLKAYMKGLWWNFQNWNIHEDKQLLRIEQS